MASARAALAAQPVQQDRGARGFLALPVHPMEQMSAAVAAELVAPFTTRHAALAAGLTGLLRVMAVLAGMAAFVLSGLAALGVTHHSHLPT